MVDKISLDYSKKMTELGIKNNILEHDSLVEAADVVAQLGYTLNDSVATLIMKADKDFIAILRRDVTKISFKKITPLFPAGRPLREFVFILYHFILSNAFFRLGC